MPQGEFIYDANVMTQEVLMPVQVTTIKLGEGNLGKHGPEGLNDEERQAITDANHDSRFEAKPSKCVDCVDGRNNEGDKLVDGAETKESSIQIPGGEAVAGTSADFMLNPNPATVGETMGKVTASAVKDGVKVLFHEKCAASMDQQKVLWENAANIDVVVPKAEALVDLLGLSDLVSQDDLRQMVLTGKAAADNEALGWNITEEEKAAIVEANGGVYIRKAGDHHEGKIRVDVNETRVFNKVEFNAEMERRFGKEIQQYAASLGAQKALVFERAAANGVSDRDAALRVAADVLSTIGIGKHQSGEGMEVDIVQ